MLTKLEASNITIPCATHCTAHVILVVACDHMPAGQSHSASQAPWEKLGRVAPLAPNQATNTVVAEGLELFAKRAPGHQSIISERLHELAGRFD